LFANLFCNCSDPRLIISLSVKIGLFDRNTSIKISQIHRQGARTAESEIFLHLAAPGIFSRTEASNQTTFFSSRFCAFIYHVFHLLPVIKFLSSYAKALTSLAGAAKNETRTMLEIAGAKLKTMPISDTHRPSAKMCNQKPEGIHHDGSLLAENSWIPKTRNEQGTTKDPKEPAPRVGDKVIFRIAPALLTNGFYFQIEFFSGYRCGS
jgi:hypothetical protein